jgi:hypothetical protein
MGYEAAVAYDPQTRLVIRWGGHNQGGGGEQNAETWAFDPVTSRWTLKEPNTSPPGVCCAQQNVFDPVHGWFLRFPAFSGSHGWQWFREIYLNNSSLWHYDPGKNVWRDMRPLPAPRVSPLRCAAWDSDHQVVVVFGGEGNQEGTLVYDPHSNTWTRRHPKTQPPHRSGGNMAYDEARKLHILFGSQFGNDPHTWAYDIRKDEWRDLRPDSQPPTDRNDAVLAYDRINQVVVAVVRVIDKEEKNEIIQGHLETWVFDTGRNTWTRMKPPREPDGKGNRRRILTAVPDQNVILMENFINPAERIPGVDREQQIWTYRYADAKPDLAPRPPTSLRVTTSSDGVTLTWVASPSQGVTGSVIYRGEGMQPWSVEYKPVARIEKTQTTFHDMNLKRGAIYWYYVRSATRAGGESQESQRVRTQPGVVEEAVVSVLSPREVELSWTPPPGQGIAGYHVERAVVEVYTEDELQHLKKDTAPLAEASVGAIKAMGNFSRLNDSIVADAKFTDRTLDLTKPAATSDETLYTSRFRPDQLDSGGRRYRYAVYAYRIRAVNALGVHSGPSPCFLTIPSAPQWVFSREVGDQCQLKWTANPERRLKGYRIYRMGSPRINGPGQPVARLTGDPIAETRYNDVQAGRQTQRYWIVAVDALGQEGFPSAPTWHYREYRRFYAPFVGDWHQ